MPIEFPDPEVEIVKVLTPVRRFLRTLLFAIAALVVAVPSVAALVGLSAEQSAQATGFALALVTVITGAINVIDKLVGGPNVDSPLLGVKVSPPTKVDE